MVAASQEEGILVAPTRCIMTIINTLVTRTMLQYSSNQPVLICIELKVF